MSDPLYNPQAAAQALQQYTTERNLQAAAQDLYDARRVELEDTEHIWYPGDLKWSASVVPQPGWLLCNGAAVSRTDYARLFNAIGTTYGLGDGSTTFNLPDLQGRFPMGVGSGAGLTPRAIGAKGGTESYALGITEIPPHSHTIPSKFNTAEGDGFRVGQASTTVGTDYDGITTGQTGNGNAHPNIPPYVALNHYIKV